MEIKRGELKGRNAVVFGLGVEGQDSAVTLASFGCRVVAMDEQKESAFDHGELNALRDAGVQLKFGSLSIPDGTSFVVRSPGIRPDHPAVLQARERHVEVTSATDLFLQWCPCPVVGVTGTKGKGTTSALIHEMLNADGRRSFLAGNIGTPVLSLLDELKKDSIVVLELSSFQLVDLHRSPQIAVMLMVTSEHLDFHPTTDQYLEAKTQIIRWQSPSDAFVVNIDYPNSLAAVSSATGRRFAVSLRQNVPNGCYLNGGDITIATNGKSRVIATAKDVLLPGRHNLENVCAAIAVVKILNVSDDAVRQALQTFRGLPHRLRVIGEVHGVRFVDDSFSTTPETTIAAIRAFSQPKVVILGGSSKQSDFRTLGAVLGSDTSVKAIIGIGVEWPRIKATLPDHHPDIIEGLTSMQDVVHAAAGVAESGDVVLLSPACASFDMFRDYKDRAVQFIREVQKLSSERGLHGIR